MRRASQHSIIRAVAVAVSVLTLSAVATARASAQSIGLEAGVASVETFNGVRPNLGASLFLPLTERFRVAVGVSQWTGCPVGGCVEPRSGYGNRGLNVLGMYRALGTDDASLSLGAGMGWYEMNRLGEAEGEMESHYEEAFTFAAEARRSVAYNSDVYLRGETSLPTDDSVTRWSSVRVGVDFRPF
jgi:hypothetical protein